MQSSDTGRAKRVEVWATSCLHLDAKNFDETLERVRAESAACDTGVRRVLLLVGDIFQAEIGYLDRYQKFCKSLITDPILFHVTGTRSATAWDEVCLIRGNNDPRSIYSLESGQIYNVDDVVAIQGSLGVNHGRAEDWWVQYHTEADVDDVMQFVRSLVEGFETRRELRPIVSPVVLAVHYPITNKMIEREDFRRAFVDYVRAARVVKVVCGHVHPLSKGSPPEVLDLRDGFMLQQITVSDHSHSILKRVY